MSAPQVPGFSLVRQLGQGASATVWAAVREADGRRFAVKVLPVGADGTLPPQAIRELAVLRHVRGDHLVRLHQVVRLDDGGVALVVDLAEGGTLGRLVTARGHLHPGELVTVVTPVCRAAAALHAAGVVHGDLSPGNVLFTARGRPLVADLGVARIVGEPRPVVHATTGFVAPEVLDGAAPTPASDVYSLGALCWYAVTGAAPSPRAGRERLATVVPGLPSSLAALVDRALSTDADERPSAGEVASVLFDTAPAVPVGLAHGSDDAARLTHRLRAQAAESAQETAPARHEARHRSPRRLRLVDPRGVAWPAVRRATVGRQLPVLAAVLVSALAAAALVGWLRGVSDREQDWPANADTRPHTAMATRGTPGSSGAHGGTSTPGEPSDPGSVLPSVRDPDAARERTSELIQQLADMRAAALAAGDPGALESVFHGSSPLLAADRRTIDAARRVTATYVGLRMSVREASYVAGDAAAAVLRARIDTSAYRTDFADGRRQRAAAHASGPLQLTLAWTDDGWRITRLEPG